MMKNAFYGGLMGLAVGDALGMPFETGARGSFSLSEDADMTAYAAGMPAGWYGAAMPVGCWTDDTAMTLAEMESIARLGRVDPEDIMQNFCRWHYEGAFSATGVAIGQGRQTLAALARYRNGQPAVVCGGASERDNGDGSLMRMLPFVFCVPLMKQAGVTTAQLSSLTHAHPISVAACEIYLCFARELAATQSTDRARRTLAGLAAPYDRLDGIEALPESAIAASGYVVHALEAALWSFLTTDTYAACVCRAINLGGDTDTIAAIAGSLAGIRYGVSAIPQRWLTALCNRELIDAIAAQFAARVF